MRVCWTPFKNLLLFAQPWNPPEGNSVGEQSQSGLQHMFKIEQNEKRKTKKEKKKRFLASLNVCIKDAGELETDATCSFILELLC